MTKTFVAAKPGLISNSRVGAFADQVPPETIAVSVGEAKMKWCVSFVILSVDVCSAPAQKVKEHSN